MALRVLNLEPYWYRPKVEAAAVESDPRYVPSEFLLGPMSFRDRARVEDMLNAKEIGEVVAFIVERNLRGWKNVLNSTGAEVAFKPDANGRPTEEQLKLIPWPILSELALEVKRRADLTEEERKNSGSPST